MKCLHTCNVLYRFIFHFLPYYDKCRFYSDRCSTFSTESARFGKRLVKLNDFLNIVGLPMILSECTFEVINKAQFTVSFYFISLWKQDFLVRINLSGTFSVVIRFLFIKRRTECCVSRILIFFFFFNIEHILCNESVSELRMFTEKKFSSQNTTLLYFQWNIMQ